MDLLRCGLVLKPHRIHWLDIRWLHHDALEDSGFRPFTKYNGMILIVFVDQAGVVVFWDRVLNPLHVLSSTEEAVSLVAFQHLPSVGLRINVWQVVVVVVGVCLARRIGREKHWHIMLELHLVALDVFGLQLQVVQAQVPEQQGVAELRTTDADMEFLVLEELQKFIVVEEGMSSFFIKANVILFFRFGRIP